MCAASFIPSDDIAGGMGVQVRAHSELTTMSGEPVRYNVRVTRDHGEVRTKRSEYADALGRRR